MQGALDPVAPVQAEPEPDLKIESNGIVQQYSGKTVSRIYDQIENPVLVILESPVSAEMKRVIYGTTDNGEIQMVLNLD